MGTDALRRVALATGFVALFAVSGCSSSEDAAAPTVTVTESASIVSETPSRGETRNPGVGDPSQASTSTEKPADDGAGKQAGKGKMPDVVCMNLQTAQNKIQESGVFFSRSEDATGKARQQLWDRNWIVVGQRPAAGTPISEGEAVLSVVKYGEPNDCPNG